MSIAGNGSRRALHFHHPPRRVVSLVPSLTESLFELGFGDSVVGITDYCVHPADQLRGLTRLGGPKNPRVEAILALQPELVLANQEENTPQTVERLEAAGVAVLVTFPKTIRQALDVLWTLTGLFHSQTAAIRLETLELSLEWAQSVSAEGNHWRYFCPIWQDVAESGVRWWMTFNQDTYIHDLLSTFGGRNIFAERQRRYPLQADLDEAAAQEPGGRDTRYPRVTRDEILAGDPQLILLPSEPFAFDETHQEQFADLFTATPAARQGRIHLVDGSLLTWHGTRLGKALQELPSLFA